MMRAALVLLMSVGTACAQGNVILRVKTYPVAPATVPTGNCPYPVDNGCAAAIAGQSGSTAVMFGRAPGGMLNQLSGSTTDMRANPNNENFPGVDYPVGAWMATSAMKDPLDPTVGIVATTPAGACTYSPTGGVNGHPQMNCTGSVGSSDVHIEDYNMTRGGTTCIPLNYAVTTTGVSTIKDNYWVNDGACSVLSGFSHATPLAIFNNAGPVEVAYNTLDANNQVWMYPYGSCPHAMLFPNNQCNARQAMLIQNAMAPVNVHHNYFKNFRTNAFGYNAFGNLPIQTWTMSYNLAQGCCATTPDEHAEWINYGGPRKNSITNVPDINPQVAKGWSMVGNTWLQTTDHMNNGNAGFPDEFVSPSLMNTVNMSDNLVIYGTSGGATPNVLVSGSATGTTFTTSSIQPQTGFATGTFGSGETELCYIAANPNDQFSIMAVYNGGAGTVSAGPAGGGHSIVGNQTSNWAMVLGGATARMTAGLDNGSGASGSTLTVTIPTIAITIGSELFNNSRHVTHMAPDINPDTGLAFTGTGGAGTYGVDSPGFVALADGQLIYPFNEDEFPGGWSVAPGLTIPCYGSGFGPSGPGQQNLQRAYGFTRAFVELNGDLPSGPRAGVSVKRNTLDMYAYAPTNSISVSGVFNGINSIFQGTIVGNRLTINSGISGTDGASCISGVWAPMRCSNGGVSGDGMAFGASWPGVLANTYITATDAALSISNVAWSATGTGQATFTVNAPSPPIAVGSEFQVSSASIAGYNGYFIAQAGTSGTTVVGQLGSGSLANAGSGSMTGTLQPFQYTLSQTYASQVGPQTLETISTICDQPGVLQDNHDISGMYSDGVLNVFAAPGALGTGTHPAGDNC